MSSLPSPPPWPSRLDSREVTEEEKKKKREEKTVATPLGEEKGRKTQLQGKMAGFLAGGYVEKYAGENGWEVERWFQAR